MDWTLNTQFIFCIDILPYIYRHVIILIHKITHISEYIVIYLIISFKSLRTWKHNCHLTHVLDLIPFLQRRQRVHLSRYYRINKFEDRTRDKSFSLSILRLPFLSLSLKAGRIFHIPLARKRASPGRVQYDSVCMGSAPVQQGRAVTPISPMQLGNSAVGVKAKKSLYFSYSNCVAMYHCAL